MPSQTLTFANAGHPSQLLFHGNDPIKELESGVFATGIVAEWDDVSKTVTFTEKSRLLLFSDVFLRSINLTAKCGPSRISESLQTCKEAWDSSMSSPDTPAGYAETTC